MKTQFQKTSRLAGRMMTSLAVAAVLTPAAANAISLSLAPPNQDAGVGDSFTLFLRVDGLGNFTAPSLAGFDVNVNFDPSLVQFDTVTFGDPGLGNLLAPVTPSVDLVTPSSGSLNLLSLSVDSPGDLDAAQPDSFTLATLNFTALTPGAAGFTLSDVILSDVLGDRLQFDGSEGATVNILAGQSVPESSPGMFGALTLGALALCHRRLGALTAK